MQIFLQNTSHMTKMFLHALALNPPNLLRKNKKKINYNLLLTTTWLIINPKKFNLLGVGVYT